MNITFRAFFLSLAVLFFTTHTAHAGKISLIGLNYSADKFVPHFLYEGAVLKGDDKLIEGYLKKFANCGPACFDADGKSSAVLTLKSPGGNYLTGLKIAKLLRRYKVATIVENKARCYSACAFAFLGGTGYSTQKGIGAYIDRTVMPGGTVGFHAPYFPDKALVKYVKDNKLPKILNGTRDNIARMVESLVEWNIDKFVIGHMVSMGPGQTYDLARPIDLFLSRSSLPPAPVSAWQPDAKQGLRNACLRLVALHNSVSINDANRLLGKKYIERFGKTKFAGVLSGFSVKSEGAFAIKACAISGDLRKATASSNYDIALYSGPALDGTYTAIFSFFNRAKGWSSVGKGATATQRIFQKGNLSHYFLDPGADMSKLKHQAGLYQISNKFFSLALPKLHEAHPLLKVARQSRSARISASGKVLFFEKIGSTTLFDSAQKQVSYRPVTYTSKSEGADTFYRSGKYKDGSGSFIWIGFKDNRTASLFRIEVLKSAPSEQDKKLMRKLSCAAKHGSMSLSCN